MLEMLFIKYNFQYIVEADPLWRKYSDCFLWRPTYDVSKYFPYYFSKQKHVVRVESEWVTFP